MYPYRSYSAHFSSLTHQGLANKIKDGKSFIRFGDGEVHILNGGKIHYQTYDKRLSDIFKESIQTYTNNSPYIIGLPYFINMTNAELRKIGQLRTWMPFKAMYTILFPKMEVYADAHFFYYDKFFEKYIEEYMFDKCIIVVTKETTIASLKSNRKIPFTIDSHIIAPEFNSFAKYDYLLHEVKETVKNNSNANKKAVVLVAVGPASKALVYELSKEGIQAIDIGIGVEYMYQNEKSLETKFEVLKKITFVP